MISDFFTKLVKRVLNFKEKYCNLKFSDTETEGSINQQYLFVIFKIK